MRCLLAMDTCSEQASVAVMGNDHLLVELSWRAGPNHTATLLPAIQRALEQIQRKIQEVDSIAVAKGPGSYNGMRVGVSTAKGLAYALGVPLVGLSTLETMAYPYAAIGLPVCSFLEAGRAQLAAALFQQQGEDWQRVQEEHLATPESLAQELGGTVVMCGEGSASLVDQLRALLGARALWVPWEGYLRRAGTVAVLGKRRLERGLSDCPHTLQPLYLRPPSVTLRP